jgi:hypothetical protein
MKNTLEVWLWWKQNMPTTPCWTADEFQIAFAVASISDLLE